MITKTHSAGRWLLTLLALGLTARLTAQQALYVEHEGKGYAVRKVHRGWVTVMVDGKAVEFVFKGGALQPVDEYLPLVVSVDDAKARSTSIHTSRGSSFNNGFLFEAEFISPVALRDVFCVLDLEIQGEGRRIFIQEVGDLKAGIPRGVAAEVNVQEKLGPGKYRLHVFTEGHEVFNSKQPAELRAAMLNKMVAKRIAGVQQSNPKPFITPAPEYPAELRKTGLQGEAAVKIRILPNGEVADPVVERASHPAFGEAALAAIREWRFLPRVEGGLPVEIKVSVPFEFSPPKESSGKKG